MKQEVVLIDLGSIYWSSWHSSANEELSAAHDRSVSAIRKYVANKPLSVVCCDSPKSWRKDIEPEYKANRPKQDSAAYEQLRKVKDTLRKDGMLLWEGEGFEADDVIATACKCARAEGHSVLIVSADKDLAQLISEGVTWLSPKTSERLDHEGAKAKWGVYPEKLRDWLAIVGDTSDNVKGVAGVGPKNAAKLLDEFGTLEAMMAASAEREIATPKIHAAIEAAREGLSIGVKLVTLCYNVPLKWEEIYELREIKPIEKVDYNMNDDDMGEPESDPMAAIGAAPVDTGNTESAKPEVMPSAPAEIVAKPQAIERAQPPQVAQVMQPGAPSWELSLEPRTMKTALELAVAIANSRLYDTKFKSAEALLAIILRGREMGMGAMTAIESMDMVEGRITLKAHTIIARAKADPDCEYFQFKGGDDTYAEYECKHRDNPDPTKLRYTIEQAVQAGRAPLKPRKRTDIPANEKDSRNQWEKMPSELLRKTCGAQLARIEFPGAAMGFYASEEFE